MIERRSREFKHSAKSIYLAMPTNTTLDQNSTSTGNHSGGLARRSQLASTRLERMLSPLSNDRG